MRKGEKKVVEISSEFCHTKTRHSISFFFARGKCSHSVAHTRFFAELKTEKKWKNLDEKNGGLESSSTSEGEREKRLDGRTSEKKKMIVSSNFVEEGVILEFWETLAKKKYSSSAMCFLELSFLNNCVWLTCFSVLEITWHNGWNITGEIERERKKTAPAFY